MAPVATLAFAPFGQLPSRGDPLAPHPEAPNSITAPLALLPSGGVILREVTVEVPRGTPVWRSFGLGERGENGGSLWWEGEAFVLRAHPERGIWTLGLWGASPVEAITIHRILLFLPPLLPTAPASPPLPLGNPMSRSPFPPSRPRALPTFRELGLGGASPHATFRNSLLFLDEETQQVVGVIPLQAAPETNAAAGVEPTSEASQPPPLPPKSSPPPSPPKLKSSPPPSPPKPDRLRTPPATPQKTAATAAPSTPTTPTSPSTPTQPPSPGALIAAQVDHITATTFLGHNLGLPSHPSPDDPPLSDSKISVIERDGSEQMPQFTAAAVETTTIELILPPSPSPNPHPQDLSTDSSLAFGAATFERRREGFSLLDDSMGPILPFPTSEQPPVSPSYLGVLRKPFLLAQQHSRLYSFASVSSLATIDATIDTTTGAETEVEWVTADEGGDSRRTSSASEWSELGKRFMAGEEADLGEEETPTPSRAASVAEQPHHPLEPSDPNAVLLQFLGSGKNSTLRMRNVTEAEINAEGLVPAGDAKESWGGWLGDVLGLKTVFNWFGGWLSPLTSPTSPSPSTKPLPSIPDSDPAPSSYATHSYFIPSVSAASLASTPRPIRRRANGGGTSRVSVVFFDNEGFGRRAFVDGAGGGFPSGVVGGY